MQPTDDNALLNEYVKSHSDEAFAGLVTRHINLVYSVALRQVSNPSHAEEIAQAVFIILAKKAASLRHEKALSSWLFQTTRLTANNFIRSEMRRDRREQEAFMQSQQNESADVVWQQIGPVLDDAVTALGEKDRRAILLRYYEGRSLREVGTVLGVSEDASEKRVSRALDKLRQFFFKRGLPSAPATIAGAISANSVQAAPIGLAKTISTVAAAKGVAATVSTLALAKGALKMMAWSNAKTAVAVIIGLAVAVGISNVVLTTHKSDYEYRGTLTLIFPMAPHGPQTNLYDVVLFSKPPNWEMWFTSTNPTHQVFSSPKQTFEVDLYDNPPNGPLNTCGIKIIPGTRPLTDRTAEHVWLALLSHHTYLHQKMPMPDPGLDMAEPSLITSIIQDSDDASPRELTWTNEFPNGRTTRLEGQFKWLAATNTPDGITIPASSEMTAYLVDANGDKTVANVSQLVINQVLPLTHNPQDIPQVPGRNVIYDYRLCDFSTLGGESQAKQYNIRDGKGLDKMPMR